MIKIIYGIFILLLGLTGCSTKSTPPKQVLQTPIPIKKDTPKQAPSKVTKTPIKPAIKPVNTYPHCQKHKKIMSHAYEYVIKEFNSAYLMSKDLKGAQAQLFLIETKSPTSFAKNINAAQESYTKNYQLAKKNGCDLTKYKPSPIQAIQEKVRSLKKASATK